MSTENTNTNATNTTIGASVIAELAINNKLDTSLIGATSSFGFKSPELEQASIKITELIAEVNGVADNNTKGIAKLIAEVDANRDWLKADGFAKTTEWTESAFGYNASTTSKLIRVYKNFLESNKQIGQAPASEYTVGQLQELLTAKPDELNKLSSVLNPTMSAKTIRGILKELKNPGIEQKKDNSVVDNKTKTKTDSTKSDVVDNKPETVEAEVVELDFLTELKLKLAQLKEHTDNEEALELAARLLEII